MASRTVSFSAILSVVAALTCPICGVHAAPVETAFPAAGGDLASPEAWGGTLPGPDAHLVLKNAGTYTLSSAAEFASIRQAAAGDFIFDFVESPGWLSLSKCSEMNGGKASIFCFPNDIRNSPCSTTLKGGTWYHPPGTSDFSVVATKIGNNYSLTLTDGCVLTNICNFNMAWMIHNFTTTIAEQSKVFAVKKVIISRNSGTNNVLRVCSGSEVHAPVQINTDSNYEGGLSYVLLDVAGEGSKVVTPSLLIGFNSGGNTVRVRDFASLDIAGGDIALGYLSTSKSNTLEVTEHGVVGVRKLISKSDGANKVLVSNATLTASTSITLASAHMLGNRMDIVDGSQVSTPKMDIGTNCVLSVSGSSLTAKTFTCCSNSFIEVSGANAVFVSNSGASWPISGIFEDGGITLVLDNGYSAKTSGHTTYIRSPGNLVRILGGSRLDFSSENYASGRLNIGSNGGWEETRDNRIEVADGGILKTDSLFIGGFDNTLVVSNGTLVAGNSETSALWLGYSYGGTSSNVMLVVAGTNTVIRCEDPATEDGVGKLSMQCKSVLRYEIPKAGYARDHVPVVAKAVTIESNCKLEVDCEEWAANGGITGNKLVLFRSPSSAGISNLEKLVAACVDTLPPGVTLSIVNGDLVLRRPGRGYRVILR